MIRDPEVRRLYDAANRAATALNDYLHDTAQDYEYGWLVGAIRPADRDIMGPNSPMRRVHVDLDQLPA